MIVYLQANLGPDLLTLHQVHHPEIDLNPNGSSNGGSDRDQAGDQATGRWYLRDKVISGAFRFGLEGAAFYDDTYLRTPQGWRILHTGYVRTF